MALLQDNRKLLLRLNVVKGAVAVVFLVLTLKLWHLTIIEFDAYQALAEKNQVRTIRLGAPRGLIVDREGRVLASNTKSFDLYLYSENLSELSGTWNFLSEAVEFDRSFVEERLEKAREIAGVHPILIREDLSLAEMSFILAHQTDRPELRIFEQPKRSYPNGRLACHVLGFVGEISKEELVSGKFKEHRSGDLVGRSGIEHSYNSLLTGEPGFRQVLVNSRGTILSEVRRVEPREGNLVELTLDLDLQRVAEEQLGEDVGAIVVLNPNNGEILALASQPAFDPNLFASRMTQKEWLQLITDPEHPLQNRAIQSVYSPGSIFKAILGMAGLAEGVVDERTTVYCSGSITLYGHPFRCWNSGGHGEVNLKQAIQHSCNIYFYLLGQKLGIDKIALHARQCGLGLPTGVDLKGEAPGRVPSGEWKRKAFGVPWYPGETISVSIGQGPMDVTPIQLGRAIGILATNRTPVPHFVDSQTSAVSVSGGLDNPNYAPEYMDLIRKSMWSVVNDWGTGQGARVVGFQVCGKTGTAQVISAATRSKLSEESQQRFAPNAWFVGFAPLENPEIVVTVIVQRGGSGGTNAAPLAGKIFERYYEKYGRDKTSAPLELARVERP